MISVDQLREAIATATLDVPDEKMRHVDVDRAVRLFFRRERCGDIADALERIQTGRLIVCRTITPQELFQ